jgi:hypothetical protein
VTSPGMPKPLRSTLIEDSWYNSFLLAMERDDGCAPLHSG